MGFDPQISEWSNPHGVMSMYPVLNKIGTGGEPPELKHLSRARKRNQPRFRVVASESGVGQTGSRNTSGVADCI